MTYAEINQLQTRVPEANQLLNRMTGCNWPLDTRKRFFWELWFARFTEDDLLTVINWICRQKHWKPEWRKSAMAFNRLIQDRDNFADRLAEARSALNKREVPKMDRNRAEVLRATGRSGELPLGDVQTSREVLAKWFDKMRAEIAEVKT